MKAAYRNPNNLAVELRTLAADGQTRAKFKPERLCSDIDQLIADLKSNLSGLKYSVAFFSLDEIKDTLSQMGNYDQALYHQYDRFMEQLDNYASQIDTAGRDEKRQLAALAKSEIAAVEIDLKRSIRDMRSVKDQVVGLI